ncbi:DUF6257 family protein [Streptomyces uncialis]|uniref:DUF6257 family protein n=1 Tax=Streptomyces uncialis TaxID=1048205 RepID=UPI00381BE603
MATEEPMPRLTAGEKARFALLVARMAKRGLADRDPYGDGSAVSLSDLQRKAERIIDHARKREAKAGK